MGGGLSRNKIVAKDHHTHGTEPGANKAHRAAPEVVAGAKHEHFDGQGDTMSALRTLQPLPYASAGQESSITAVFTKLDRSKCGLLDKEEVVAWLEVNQPPGTLSSVKQRIVDDRITLAEFTDIVHYAQRLELQRALLALEIPKIIAEAVRLGDSTDELAYLRGDGAVAQVVQSVVPSIVACIKSGLMQSKAIQEKRLRQTARTALGLHEAAEEKMMGLQADYSRQLKQHQMNLSQITHGIELKRVPRFPTKPAEDYIVGGITGLVDVGSLLKLKKDLWLSAGGSASSVGPADDPVRKPKLVKEDTSTWTWSNLSSITDVQPLAELQRHAGPHYIREVAQAINLMKLTDSCANILPFHISIYAQDKHDLCHSAGKRVVFNLSMRVFQVGNKKNSGEILTHFKNHLCMTYARGAEPQTSREACRVAANNEAFLQLLASPIHVVTLPPAVRVMAGIPTEAMFYCFCYPLLSTLGTVDHESGEKEGEVPDAVFRAQQIWCEFAGHTVSNAMCICSHDESGCKHNAQCPVKTLDGQEALDFTDPFVCLLMFGGFLYFNNVYDIVAINSVCFDEVKDNTSALYLGASAPLPLMSVDPLHQANRWKAVTLPRLRKMGYTHFAWICPSEFLGDSIFTRSGGFAYLHTDPKKSCYFPVTPKVSGPKDNADFDKQGKPELITFDNVVKFVPQPYDAPLHIPELMERAAFPAAGEAAHMADKFMGAPETASFGAGKGSALGIRSALWRSTQEAYVADLKERTQHMSMEADQLHQDAAIQLMQREVEAMKKHEEWSEGYAVCKEWLDYVVEKPANELTVTGNDGFQTVQDLGHGGMRLETFHAMEQSQVAELHMAEVAALRYYTTAAFKWINNPLRRKALPHPLAMTTLYIYEGLKKLRAIHLSRTTKFTSTYLWRGMKDRALSTDFMVLGGCELACMSTSEDLKVVAGYAASRSPLLFRIKVDSPMDLGAKIDWCSVFPGEAEVLYPPLTFLKPMFEQPIMGDDGKPSEGVVVTVKPSFPT